MSSLSGGGARAQMTICKNIVKGRVVYPDYITDIAVREVIFGLLTKYVVARCRVVCVCLMSMSVSYARVVVTRNVATRLGCSKNGVNDIKAQKWFNGASPLLSFSLLCSALLCSFVMRAVFVYLAWHCCRCV